MLPTLNRWISEPTPVTTSSITVDNWSTCSAKSTCSVPTGIHDQYRNTTGSSAWRPTKERNTATATTEDATRTPTPMMDTSVLALGRASDTTPFSTKPSSASAGASQIWSTAVPVIRP